MGILKALKLRRFPRRRTVSKTTSAAQNACALDQITEVTLERRRIGPSQRRGPQIQIPQRVRTLPTLVGVQ
jgi:hypothetical protein